MAEWLVQMRAISKHFEGQYALKGADLSVRAGEIHALIGENGAGKSTLMKILAGALSPDAGQLLFEGEPVQWSGSKAARDAGFVMVYQEPCLYPELTVEENIFLGRKPPLRFVFPFHVIDWRQVRTMTKELLSKLQFDLSPGARVADLGLAERQMVEVARALGTHLRLLILDEPTAALSEPESKQLFRMLRQMRRLGVAIIFISHRVSEIAEIADRITVLRDGRTVATREANAIDVEDLVALMAGHELSSRYPKLPAPRGREILRVEDLSVEPILREINLTLYEGEILGLGGMAGSGRTALAQVLFGLKRPNKGRIWIEGKPFHVRNPAEAIRRGIGFVTEDRANLGLAMEMGTAENITLSKLQDVTGAGIIQSRIEDAKVAECVERLGIITRGLHTPVKVMSGGNQQKVVLGRTLFCNCRLLLLDEPTRGLDIASKVDMYNIMNHLILAGTGILLISSDLPELLGMCNRVLVMKQGRIAGELKGSAVTEENFLRLAYAPNEPR